MLLAEGNSAPTWMSFLGPIGGALVTGLVALLVWWLNKSKPQKLLVSEIDTFSLLHIAEKIKPRLAATLDGKPVGQLAQVEYKVTNGSEHTIRQAVISLEFPKETQILECELSGVDAKHSGESLNTVAISIAFINSFRHHRDCLSVKVVCDGGVTPVRVTGRGEGWSVVHVTIRDALMTTLKVCLGYFLMAVCSLGLGVVVSWAYVSIWPMAEGQRISVPLLLIQIMCVVMAVGFYIAAMRRFSKTMDVARRWRRVVQREG